MYHCLFCECMSRLPLDKVLPGVMVPLLMWMSSLHYALLFITIVAILLLHVCSARWDSQISVLAKDFPSPISGAESFEL